MSLADKYKTISLADKYSHLSDDSSMDEETSSPVQQREPTNMAETFAKSMAKGSTFGFSDELGGALQSGLDTVEGLFGDSPSEVNERLREQGFTGDSLDSSIYRQGQQEALKDINQAESDNPGTAMAGNFAGAILPSGVLAKLIGGGAKAAAATNAGSKIPIVHRLLSSVARGSVGEGGIASHALAGAAGGAVEGALQGAGTANSAEEIPKETLSNAYTGAKWGGGLGGVLKTLGLGAGAVSRTPFGEDIKQYFKLGRKYGSSGFDSADKAVTQAQIIPSAEKAVDDMTGEIERVAEARDAALKAMPPGIKLNMADVLEGKPTYQKNTPKYEFAENIKTEDISNLKKYNKARIAAQNNGMIEVVEHPPEIKQELSAIDGKIAELISNPEVRSRLLVTAPDNIREAVEEVSRKVGQVVQGVGGVSNGDELSKLLKQSQVGKLLEKASSNTSSEAKMIKDLLAQKKLISLHPKTEKVLTPNVHVENTIERLKEQAQKSLAKSGIDVDVDTLADDIDGLIEAKKTAGAAPTINAGTFDNLSPNQQAAMADLVSKAETLAGKSDVSGEDVLAFWKDLKGMEKTTNNVPELRDFIKSLKNKVRDEISKMGGEFSQSNDTLRKLFDVKEGLTGVRSTSKTRDTTAQEIKKLYNAANTEQSLYGDTVELQKAKDSIGGLPEQSKEKMTRIVDNIEEIRKLGALFDSASNRQLSNVFSKTVSRAVPSTFGKLSAEIPKPVLAFGKAVGSMFVPDMLYNQKTMQSLSAKSPTIAKLYERLTDQTTSEAKRRAIHNMLLNNPIVRKEIEKDN